jgi:hypothetical protein
MADITPSSDNSQYDLLKEECESFAKAARKLPKVRGENHLAPSTLYRWATQGRRSRSGEIVYLESIRVGGTNCTSMEALARFFARLGGDEPPGPAAVHSRPIPANPLQSSSVEKRVRQANEILRQRGIIK